MRGGRPRRPQDHSILRRLGENTIADPSQTIHVIAVNAHGREQGELLDARLECGGCSGLHQVRSVNGVFKMRIF